MGISRNVPITKTDFQRENIENEITSLVANGKLDIFNLLEEYKNCGEELSPLENQFYKFFKTMAEDFFRHDSEKALRNYEEALRLSIKNYKLGSIPDAQLLTKTELLILNNISRTQYFLEQKDKAIELMEFLRIYFEKGIMGEEEKAKYYHVILFNLENWYGLCNKDDKVLELCDIGIKECIKNGKLSTFPYQLFNKGCSLVKLGKIEEGKNFLKDSFVILNQMKKNDDIEHGKKWLKENLNLEL